MNFLKLAYKQVLREGRESKNMSLAKHYLYTNKGYSEEEALKVIGAIKTDVSNVRLQKCKFILGVTRMFCEGQLSDGKTIMNLNKCLKFVASDAHVNEYNENLNDMPADELINRFASSVADDLENEKENLSKTDYNINNDYTIVPINSFEEAKEYGNYTDWCVTHYDDMYDSYTFNGIGRFYFCLKNGYENVERVQGENCPLDEYGLSMIAVSVDSDGSCNTITCRWNHDNRGNDHIMTTEQLSNLIGQNFYGVFKPYEESEIEQKIIKEVEYIYNHEVYEYREDLVKTEEYYDDNTDTYAEREVVDESSDRLDYVGNDEQGNEVYLYYSFENDNECILVNKDLEIFSYLLIPTYDTKVIVSSNIIKVENDNGITKYYEAYSSKKIGDRIYGRCNDELRNYPKLDYFTVCDSRTGKFNLMKDDGSYLLNEWWGFLRPFENYPGVVVLNKEKSENLINTNSKNGVSYNNQFIVYDINKGEVILDSIEVIGKQIGRMGHCLVQFRDDWNESNGNSNTSTYASLYTGNLKKQIAPWKFKKYIDQGMYIKNVNDDSPYGIFKGFRVSFNKNEYVANHNIKVGDLFLEPDTGDLYAKVKTSDGTKPSSIDEYVELYKENPWKSNFKSFKDWVSNS